MRWAQVENGSVVKILNSLNKLSHTYADDRKIGDLGKADTAQQIEAGYYPLEEITPDYDSRWQTTRVLQDDIMPSKVIRYYEIIERSINELKAAKIVDISEYTAQQKNADFQWNGKQWQADLESRINIDFTYDLTSAGDIDLSAFNITGTPGFPWRASDDTSHYFTSNAEFGVFAKTTWAQKAGIHFVSVSLKSAVIDLTTAEEVGTYDISANWSALEATLLGIISTQAGV